MFLWGAGALDRDCGSAPSGVLREAAVIRQRPETESRGCSPRPSTVSWGTSSPLVCPLPLFFAPCPRARRELWERAVGGVVRGCGDPTAPRDRFSRVQSAAVVRDLGDLKSGTNAFGGGTSARFGPPRAAWWEHGRGIAGLLKWDSVVGCGRGAQHLGMRRESGSTTTPARRSGQSSSGARRRPPAVIDKSKNRRYTVNFRF